MENDFVLNDIYLNKQIEELKAKVESLQSTIDALADKLSRLESRVYAMHMNY